MNYKVPYDFILRMLYPVRPKIRKMLGGYALFQEKKLLFFLRERDNEPEFNGVFVAVQQKDFADLQKEIHQSKMEFDLDGSEDQWIFISEDLEDFEAKLEKACGLIKAGDKRMGKL